MIRYSRSIKVPLYACKFIYTITPDVPAEINNIRKKHPGVAPIEGPVEGVMIAPDEDITVYYLVLDLKYLSYNTIGHEIYHLIRAFSKHRDTNNDEESCAWLAGFVHESFIKFVFSKKLKIKS